MAPFRIYDQDAAWDGGSTTHRFNNAHLGIWYDFAIRMCNDDYGCSYPLVTYRDHMDIG